MSAQTSRAAELHASSEIREVPLDKIRVDRSYQRDPSIPLADRIAEDWDVVASELVLVSDRGNRPKDGPVEGGLFIVNGQHRTIAAKKLGIPTIWARVIDLRKHHDPAAVEAEFRLKTNIRLGDRPHERFKAQLRSGNPESHAIQALLEKFNTELNLTPQAETGINCITTVETVYRFDNGALLKDTLEVIRDSFRVVGGKNVNAGFLKGTAWFIEKHADQSDVSRLCEKLSVLGVPALERKARTMQSVMGGSVWLNYYRTLVDLYNDKLADRNRLEWSTRGSRALNTKSRTTGESQAD